MVAQTSVTDYQKHEGCEQTGILGYERAESHTVDLHSAGIYQTQTRHDVDHILHNGDEHRYACVLHTYEPARHTVKAQHGGSTPYAYAEIDADECGYVWRGTDNRKGETQERTAEQYYHNSDGKTHRERAQQQPHHLRQVAPSERLGGHTARAHTQESEYPVYHIEYHGTHRYRPYIHRVAHVPYNGDIDKTEQRHCYIGDNGRECYVKYLTVDMFHINKFVCFIVPIQPK